MITRVALSLALLIQGTTAGPKVTVGPKVTLGAPTSGGSPITFRRSASADGGNTATPAAVDLGAGATAGDLIVVAVTMAVSPPPSITSVCDNTVSGACSSSLSTYSTLTRGCEGSPTVCTQFAYTCNAASGARFVTVVLTSAADETVTVLDFAHSVTSGCADAHPASVPATGVGATITSNTYSTAVANEVAVSLFADDQNCGPSFTGTAGTGFTLVALATGCNSMLGAAEYQIYSATQTNVTSGLNTGNSAGNDVNFDTATWK